MKSTGLNSTDGWLATMACIIIGLLQMIPLKLSGLFFIEILERYDTSRALASYTFFSSMLVRCSAGPLAGYCSEMFGVYEVIIVGAILSGLGVSVCFLAEEMTTLIIFLGLVYGVGLTFSLTLFPQILKQHFDKNLTLAISLATSGASFGGLAAPTLLKWISQSYGVSGTFLILGGIMLNAWPAAMLLKYLNPNRKQNESKSSTSEVESKQNEGKSSSPEIHKDEIEFSLKNSPTSAKNSFQSSSPKDDQAANELVLKDSPTSAKNSFQSSSPEDDQAVNELALKDSPTSAKNSFQSSSPEVDQAVNELVLKNSPASDKISFQSSSPEVDQTAIEFALKDSSTSVKNSFKSSSLEVDQATIEFALKDSPTSAKNEFQKNNEGKNALLQNCFESAYPSSSDEIGIRRQEKYVTSSKNVSETYSIHLKKPLAQEDEMLIDRALPKEASMLFPKYVPPVPLKSLSTEAKPVDQKPVLKNKAALQSLSIFLDLAFLTMLISQSAAVIIQVLTQTTILDYLRDKNVDRSYEVYFLMSLSLAEIVGRVISSMIIDRNYMTKLNFTIFSFIMLAAVLLIMVWSKTLIVLMAEVIVFGMLNGALLSVFPMLVFQFMEPKNHMMAMASRVSLYGPMSFTCGPLIGYFRGTCGSYDGVYCIQAIMSVVCAVLTWFTPCYAKRRNRKNKKLEDANLNKSIDA